MNVVYWLAKRGTSPRGNLGDSTRAEAVGLGDNLGRDTPIDGCANGAVSHLRDTAFKVCDFLRLSLNDLLKPI